MLSRVVNVVAQVADAALGIVGVRVLTEEPSHTTKKLTGIVEIRRYEPRIAAETTVENVGEEEARSDGFRRLAGYIFGGNQAGEKVAMTAPVSQGASKGQKIAMTAPVSTSKRRERLGGPVLHAVQVDDGDASDPKGRAGEPR